MAAADQFLCYNPANGSVWRVAGNTKRLVLTDEYNFYHGFLGEPVIVISSQWFNSIPIAS